MFPQPPPGQGPVDPRGAFTQPPAPGSAQGPGAPPPGFMPPMMPMMMPPFYPPPPAPRGRSFADAIFTTLATTILSISLIANVVLLLVTASNADAVKEETLVEGNSSEQIAVIPIHGVIDDRMVQQFEKMIKRAEENSSVKAIVLDIDSPGGGVTSADEIYARIKTIK